MIYAVPTDDLRLAIGQQDTAEIQKIIAAMNPADLAEFLHSEEADTALGLLTYLPIEERAEAFGYLNPEGQKALANQLSPVELARLMTHMAADERADLFNLVDEDHRDVLLREFAHAEREDLRRLSSYEEGSAGAIMTSDYAVLPQNVRVDLALEILRTTAPDKETIYQAYVIDQEGRLVGTVSLRDLILASPHTNVSTLLKQDVIHASVETPQEEVARLISRYDLIALPITNGGERLVGIVTYDDAMDVAEAEATEDIHKSATIGKIEGSLRTASLWTLYRTRIIWLIVLVFVNILSGAGIAVFEETISTYVSLVFFLPLLIASGGNAGAQSATLMVRGLALGDVDRSDWLRLLGREFLVAVGLGLSMAFTVSFIGMMRGGPTLAMVVAMSIVVIVLIGSLVGMSLPFVFNRLGWDPATASGPLVTSVADITGVLVYLSIATWLLGLPAST